MLCIYKLVMFFIGIFKYCSFIYIQPDTGHDHHPLVITETANVEASTYEKAHNFKVENRRQGLLYCLTSLKSLLHLQTRISLPHSHGRLT